ncbi:MAG: aspartate kinase [Desulfobacterales bacterium]|nr:MAG: aspartate kinase [Desulfobacterales bacterium]
MGVFVQKFGGTSVADLDRIRNVARRVRATYDKGHNVVVILSAMAGVTDNLIEMAGKVTDRPERRELDVLLSTGEQTTAALLAMILIADGYPAQSLLGYQAQVRTDCSYGRARILNVGTERIQSLLDQRKIVVVAGFQGCDAEGNITTLGRGGSDTSAVAIAAGMKADVCEIYTDVDGIYTTDPHICRQARKLRRISYDEMLEMASLGARVLQIRSVEFAKKYNVPVHVRSSFSEEEGTMVMDENIDMERLVVSGVTCSKNEARIAIKGVPDQPGIAARVLTPVSDAGINIDMIIQSSPHDERNNMAFTVPRTEFGRAMEIMERVKAEIGADRVNGDMNIAKVSVVGVGMKSHSGVAAKMFQALADENINIRMISTSEIHISCVITEKYAELAVRTLHNAFELDKA